LNFTTDTQKIVGKMFEWHSDPETRKCMGGPHKELPPDQYYKNICSKLNKYNFLMGLETDNKNIMACFYFQDYNKMNGTTWIHFAFEPGFLKFKQVCGKLADRIFRDVRQIHGLIHNSNEKALNVVDKMGFRFLGLFPDYYREGDGFEDAHHFVLEDKNRRF